MSKRKRFLSSISVLLSTLGIFPTMTMRALIQLPAYSRDLRRFKRSCDWQVFVRPYLLDRSQESAALGEYFWQDLYVARKLLYSDVGRHIDVGSRIDGFVAHVAAVQQVEVFDVRPLRSEIENILFRQADITKLPSKYVGVADCVTCLHTLEHIGLGRYGDELNVDGWKAGFDGLKSLLAPGGQLWLSVPLGQERVEFNAHRVFSPHTIVEYADHLSLSLTSLAYVKNDGLIVASDLASELAELGSCEYALGIFRFCSNDD
jgi:hypothetical protein